MKQITINGKEILLIEVPEDATKFFIVNHDDLNLVWRKENDVTGFEAIPKLNWKLIGKGNELSEEDWKGIVQGYGKMYMDYTSKLNGLAAHSLTLIQSGCSLVSSHSMKPETTLILEKVL